MCVSERCSGCVVDTDLDLPLSMMLQWHLPNDSLLTLPAAVTHTTLTQHSDTVCLCVRVCVRLRVFEPQKETLHHVLTFKHKDWGFIYCTHLFFEV